MQTVSIKWGFGSFHVVNMFALISTDPKALLEAEDPIGPKNDYYIKKRAEQADKIIAAWGSHSKVKKREERVYAILRKASKDGLIYCLDLTKDEHPRHPLYVKANLEPVRMFFGEEKCLKK